MKRPILGVLIAANQVASIAYQAFGKYDQATFCAVQACFLLLLLLLVESKEP